MTQSTPYASYLRSSTLHTLQKCLTPVEGELSFLMVSQVQELYFSLIGQELATTTEHLKNRAVESATAALLRVTGHFKALNASWESLSWMRATDFLPIKDALSKQLGKSSPVQSWKYRTLVYRLGLKTAPLADAVKSMPEQHGELVAVLHSPSVYDEALAVLGERGLPVPTDVLDRDLSLVHDPRPEVERAWGAVYSDTDAYGDLARLADALLATAEGFAEYKHLHLLATRRTFGNRPGFYGKSGVEWLADTMRELPFPELWSVRLGTD
ncbi:tryptophan 2,3-dioxygenase [Streptomyces sp. NPDC004393]